MTTDHADIDRHVRVYITVFVALMVLTVVTVAITRVYLPVPIAGAITVLFIIERLLTREFFRDHTIETTSTISTE